MDYKICFNIVESPKTATLPDFPGLHLHASDRDTIQEAVAVEFPVYLHWMMSERMPIPMPTPVSDRADTVVSLSLVDSTRIIVHNAMLERNLTVPDLARLMLCVPAQLGEAIDLLSKRPSIDILERALSALSMTVALSPGPRQTYCLEV